MTRDIGAPYWPTASYCQLLLLISQFKQIGVRLPTCPCTRPNFLLHFSEDKHHSQWSDEQVTNSWFYEIPARMSHRLASWQSRHPVTLILTMSMLSFATLIRWILTTNGDVTGLRIKCLDFIFYKRIFILCKKHQKASDHESNQETQKSTVGQLVNKHKWIDRMNNWTDFQGDGRMNGPTTLSDSIHPWPLSALKFVATPWGWTPVFVTVSREISQVPNPSPSRVLSPP